VLPECKPHVVFHPHPEPACELGQWCVAQAGAWLATPEIDRLRAGPLCREHRLHVIDTLLAVPQWTEREEPDGSVWLVPTPSALSLARFLVADPPGWVLVRGGRRGA